MAIITAARRVYKDTDNTTDCVCIRIGLTNGSIFRFTDNVVNLIMTQTNNNGVLQSLPGAVTYSALDGFNISAFGSSEMSASDLDIEGILRSGGIEREKLHAGLFDRARIYVFYTSYKNPVEDDEKKFTGFWGSAETVDKEFKLRFTSLIDALNVDVGEVRTVRCRVALGSSRCGVRISASDWQASTSYLASIDRDARVGNVVKPTVQTGYWYRCVTAGTSGVSEPTFPTSLDATVSDGTVVWAAIRANIFLSSVDTISGVILTINDTPPADFNSHASNGFVEITSGTGVGQKRKIISNTGVEFTLEAPFVLDPNASDTVSINAGCTKRLIEDCGARYNNTYNYQGDPYLPGSTNVGYVGGTK